MLCELLHQYRKQFNEFVQRLGAASPQSNAVRLCELLLEADSEFADSEYSHAAGFAKAIREVLRQLLSAEQISLGKVRMILSKRHYGVLGQWLPTALANYKRHGSLWLVVSDEKEEGATWTAATTTGPTPASQPVSEQMLAIWHVTSTLAVGLSAVGEVLSSGGSICELVSEAACELIEAILEHGRELVSRAWAEVHVMRFRPGVCLCRWLARACGERSC